MAQDSIRTIHAALDEGVTLLDTGDFYGQGHNELLLREALSSKDRSKVFIGVRFGVQRDPSGAPAWSAESAALASAERQEVLRALRKLPGRQREALLLRYYLELSELGRRPVADSARGRGCRARARRLGHRRRPAAW